MTRSTRARAVRPVTVVPVCTELYEVSLVTDAHRDSGNDVQTIDVVVEHGDRAALAAIDLFAGNS